MAMRRQDALVQPGTYGLVAAVNVPTGLGLRHGLAHGAALCPCIGG